MSDGASSTDPSDLNDDALEVVCLSLADFKQQFCPLMEEACLRKYHMDGICKLHEDTALCEVCCSGCGLLSRICMGLLGIVPLI